MQQPSSSKFKCCLLRRSSISIIMILIIFLVISSSVSSYPSKSKFANSKPQKMMSAFANSLSANRSLQRQLRGQLAVPKGANAHLVHRSHFLQMSTISSPSQSPSSSQAFALPPDNFSRYSKFLVRTSNVVDGMGKHHLLHKNSHDKEELLPWVDTLGVNEETTTPFSILSWNILAQTLYESHHRTKRIQQVALLSNNKQQQLQSPIIHYPHTHPWSKRFHRIIQTLSHSNADIICLQECELQSFTEDLAPYMSALGYDGIAQEDTRKEKPAALKEASKHRDPRNHIGATFWKRDRFELVRDVDVSVRTRSLSTVLRVKKDSDDNDEGKVIAEKKRNSHDEKEDTTTTMPTVAIVNCHLEGHPKRFLERTLQLQHALSDLSKMIVGTRKEKSIDNNDGRSSGGLNALILAGDFNCELQSSACSTYLRMGRLGRQAGLGGIHGEDALVIPQSLLETSEAAEILSPIIEWGRALPEEKVGDISPHPFRRNGMTSAYPTWLGREDAGRHFTYCGENRVPVPGLDQIWYSSMTIERVGLKRMFVDSGEWRCISDENVLSQLRDHERGKVLSTGLPSPDGKYPSDHLPIGAVFDWKLDVKSEENSSSAKHGNDSKDIRRLQIVDDEGNNVEEDISQDGPTALIEEQQCFETPNHELAFLKKNCPFDTLEQQSDVNFLLQPINPPIDLKIRKAPTPEQLEQLNAKREKKAELLKSASLSVRPWMKKIWKVEKQVGKWERRQLMTRK
mmetsp:Transcript_3920/g.6680  ORF Transcript_3920/g.6680 Transcript_3920/m.6680 type:complete len:740 (-) Transcript_3920:85-2304(-)